VGGEYVFCGGGGFVGGGGGEELQLFEIGVREMHCVTILKPS